MFSLPQLASTRDELYLVPDSFRDDLNSPIYVFSRIVIMMLSSEYGLLPRPSCLDQQIVTCLPCLPCPPTIFRQSVVVLLGQEVCIDLYKKNEEKNLFLNIVSICFFKAIYRVCVYCFVVKTVPLINYSVKRSIF